MQQTHVRLHSEHEDARSQEGQAYRPVCEGAAQVGTLSLGQQLGGTALFWCAEVRLLPAHGHFGLSMSHAETSTLSNISGFQARCEILLYISQDLSSLPLVHIRVLPIVFSYAYAPS